MSSAIKMVGITKTFGDLVANDKINFELKKGEVHGLLGENGAGKTVLMSVLYGIYKPDEGQIFVNNKEVQINNSAKAIELGIGMVHQHFMLVPSLNVAENIVLGREPKNRQIFFDADRARICQNSFRTIWTQSKLKSHYPKSTCWFATEGGNTKSSFQGRRHTHIR